jgi:hypothetical protein
MRGKDAPVLRQLRIQPDELARPATVELGRHETIRLSGNIEGVIEEHDRRLGTSQGAPP